MSLNKITSALWFSAHGGNIAILLDYYKKIFANDFIAESIIPLGTTPSGNAEMCNIEIYGQKYFIMCTEKEHHPLNDSFAIIINCENQHEIDKFWDYFTKEGKESQCGWCIDKYGLRWQIIPNNLNELLSKPNGWQVMMKQKKIIIGEY